MLDIFRHRFMASNFCSIYYQLRDWRSAGVSSAFVEHEFSFAGTNQGIEGRCYFPCIYQARSCSDLDGTGCERGYPRVAF